MKGRANAVAAKRAKSRRQSESNLWLWLIAGAGLVIIALGIGLYIAGSQGPTGAQGKLSAPSVSQDIGTVPYEGGLAKATYTITAQGNPVMVKSLTTT